MGSGWWPPDQQKFTECPLTERGQTCRGATSNTTQCHHAVLPVRTLRVLGKDDSGVGAEADISLSGHAIDSSAECFCVVAVLITEIRAVAIPVAVEAHLPQSSARQSNGVALVGTIAEIGHHD